MPFPKSSLTAVSVAVIVLCCDGENRTGPKAGDATALELVCNGTPCPNRNFVLRVGDTLALGVRLRDAFGSEVPLPRPPVFTSRLPEYVTVTVDGRITPLAMAVTYVVVRVPSLTFADSVFISVAGPGAREFSVVSHGKQQKELATLGCKDSYEC